MPFQWAKTKSAEAVDHDGFEIVGGSVYSVSNLNYLYTHTEIHDPWMM